MGHNRNKLVMVWDKGDRVLLEVLYCHSLLINVFPFTPSTVKLISNIEIM